MGMLLTLTANDPQASSYTVLNGAGTDVWTLIGANWGNAVWDTQYTGPRGTLGARATSATVGNRSVSLVLRSLRHANVPAASTHLAELTLVVDRMRKYGGRITYRSEGRLYRQHLEVFAGSGGMADWTNNAEHRARYEVTLGFTCGPYVFGDPMGFEDRFLTDTEADYTFDLGSAANVTVAAGQVKSTATAADHALIHTAFGYRYGDHQATIRAVPATLTNHGAGAIIKRTASGTHLQALIFDDGATSTLYLESVVGGGKTTLASSAVTRISVGQAYYVAARLEGNTVYAEYWAPANPPTLGGTASTAVSAVLTGTPRTTFGEGTTGQAGLLMFPASVNDAVELLRVDPYTYRGANFTGWSAPDEFRLDGDIPGDAPALAEVQVAGEGVSADYTRFGMLTWSRRPTVHNLIPVPPTAPFRPQWTTGGVTGVTGASTSSTVVSTGGRFGPGALEVVCPATANTGIACAMYRRFRAGVTYTAEMWVRSAAATTNFRIRLGVNGNISSETAAALSSGWVRRTVTWTPTATVTQAYIAGEITAATATTWQLDGVRVYEGTVAPTSAGQINGYTGRPPFGLLDAGEAIINNVTLTSGSTTNYVRGRFLDFPITADGVMWNLDPSLIPRDDLAQGLDVEVWAFGKWEQSDTWVALIRGQGSSPGTSPSKASGLLYTREFGSNGYTIPTGGLQGWVRFGTLPLDALSPGFFAAKFPNVALQLVSLNATSSTEVTCVVLAPARSRACGPTAKPDDADYPRFSVNTDAFHRTFTPELRGVFGTPGLGGSLLEVEPGPVDFVLAASQYIPGTTSASVTKLRQTAALQVTPIPRWHQLRDE